MTRALIIEDDRSVGTAIQMILARQGFTLVLAPDAQSGVQAFVSSKFDVVLVDIFMPEIDGLAIITAFRQRAPTVPILAMSGFRFREPMDSGQDFLGMAAELGATSCLRKPFTPEQLIAAVNNSLDFALSGDRTVGSRDSR
jgi:DNA-binding response OmpR family regulator